MLSQDLGEFYALCYYREGLCKRWSLDLHLAVYWPQEPTMAYLAPLAPTLPGRFGWPQDNQLLCNVGI